MNNIFWEKRKYLELKENIDKAIYLADTFGGMRDVVNQLKDIQLKVEERESTHWTDNDTPQYETTYGNRS